MIIQQHWFWQHRTNLGQGNIWVTKTQACPGRHGWSSQPVAALLADCDLPQAMQNFVSIQIIPAHQTQLWRAVCGRANIATWQNGLPLCWSASYGFWHKLFETSSCTRQCSWVFPEKEGNRKAHWLIRNPAPGVHVKTRAGDPCTFRKSNQIGQTAHRHTSSCHPPRPAGM